MAEDTTTPETGDAPADDDDATKLADAGTGDVKADGTDDDAFDKDRAMATIRKQREEAKELRAKARRAEELETRIREIEDAEKSELEKAQQKIADYEAQAAERGEREQALRLRLAAYNLRDTLGIADVDLALAAIDRSQVEYGDDGEPANLEEVMAALLEAKPLLKGKAKAKAPEVNAGEGGAETAPPALTAEQLAAAKELGMTPEAYAAFATDRVTTIDDYRRIREKQNAAATT